MSLARDSDVPEVQRERYGTLNTRGGGGASGVLTFDTRRQMTATAILWRVGSS